MQLTRTHRILIGVVVAGAVLIAAIGFAGSYAAVRDLAEQKGFGAFSTVFPIGIDAGIVVLLALDLLLTWIRIPFPLLRQTAWLLTAATIAFNGAAAWPDPLGVGMHAVIPVLFVVSVEAARHAIGRIADITADKHMEGVRLSRWLLAFPSTFRLWRRMKLWELRSYDEVIRLEQDRLVYQARLRARYGRAWRRKAPVESMMPLRLARYGVPLAETAPDGLAAAGIDPAAPAGRAAVRPSPRRPELTAGEQHSGAGSGTVPEGSAAAAEAASGAATSHGPSAAGPAPGGERPAEHASAPESAGPAGYGPADHTAAGPGYTGTPEYTAASGGTRATAYGSGAGPLASAEPASPRVTVPVAPGRERPLGSPQPYVPAQSGPFRDEPDPAAEEETATAPGLPDDMSREEAYFGAFRRYVAERGDFPNARQFGLYLMDLYGIRGRTGGPLSESSLRGYLREFRHRYTAEMDTEHIA
ncbi:DUF2637 domain-containing protein [Streptomyces sp. F63]|uniref:DUF2637 domain-containing protein n=1 Tax=Streptomyces sp. F63 TaxID=2824887 RepID=UPI0024954BD4|nr:DUF2637 domain-containing protein [Streptomyces sp. F63]